MFGQSLQGILSFLKLVVLLEVLLNGCAISYAT